MERKPRVARSRGAARARFQGGLSSAVGGLVPDLGLILRFVLAAVIGAGGAFGVGAAVVFPDYSLSPEARYPVAIEESYAVATWVAAHGAEKSLDGSRIAVAGDSVGGNMSAALTLMAKERGGVSFAQQVLFYPVTDAAFDTGSYHQFATGYFLRRDGMQWFWDQYTTDPKQLAEITASPLRAPATRNSRSSASCR